MDSRILWPDGSVRWMTTAARALCDDAGRPIRVLGAAMDITDRKRLEEQYLQAQKLESVGQLAGGIAHDFNNLLTILLGNGDLTRQMLGPAHPASAYLREMLDAAERASGLTRQLLAFSRRQVLDPRVVDLNGLLKESEDFLHRLLGEDIDLVVQTGPAACSVRVDSGSMSQVVLNLAVNARDAMPKGGRLVIATDVLDLDASYAAAHLDVKPGTYVRLTVSDTGTGMTPDVRARVFEPFFTTKEEGKGTGLGLSVVHGIIRGSGGRVEVYSEAGIGTTFKVYLPAVGAEHAGPPAVAAPPAGRGAETVLLVEDDVGVRRLAERILTHNGYRVLSAPNGEEAVRMADVRKGELDLLLTDLVMPGMNGRELASVLRSRLPGLRVLFTSGYTSDAILRAGVLESEEAFLTKPYTPALFLAKVREVLDAPAPSVDARQE
jgi:signal transduction histidine kinase